jgi:hypothetical protein
MYVFQTRKYKKKSVFWYPCLGRILVYKNADKRTFLPQGEIAKRWTQGVQEKSLDNAGREAVIAGVLGCWK